MGKTTGSARDGLTHDEHIEVLELTCSRQRSRCQFLAKQLKEALAENAKLKADLEKRTSGEPG